MSQADTDVYKAQGFGNPVGLGARPALVLVDFVNGFVDPAIFGGGNIAESAERTCGLLDAARGLGLPVALSRVVYADDGSDACAFTRKVPALAGLTETAPASQFVPNLLPAAGEKVLRKTQPSAFFGTDLADWLRAQQVDTLIVTGCTTSGCVRATVVDSMSHGFRTIVARDCVGDRSIAAHDANLFDMEQKYADVMMADDIVAALRRAVAA